MMNFETEREHKHNLSHPDDFPGIWEPPELKGVRGGTKAMSFATVLAPVLWCIWLEMRTLGRRAGNTVLCTYVTTRPLAPPQSQWQP